MIGKLAYRFQRAFEHGLKTAWYRDVVRHRILNTEPITDLNDDQCEIHVLTSTDDCLNLIWTLKSFYTASDRKYMLAIHDDGTLDAPGRALLQQHFPDACVVNRAVANREVLETLVDFPHCYEFRSTNHLAPKLFDFRHYLNSDRMFLLDSDVLFFSQPTELLKRIEDPGYLRNTVNSDVQTSYTVDAKAVKERFGFELIDRFNSGLGLIHRDSLRLDWLEEFLGFSTIKGHFWRIEQTLFALCSCKFGVELLPAEYDVFLDGQLNGQPSRHYVGAVRHEMYREGMRRLQNLLRIDNQSIGSSR